MSRRMEDLRSELLIDVATHSALILRDHGIAEDVADQCGAAIADHLAETWGGQVISVPKDYAYRLSQRDQAILAEYTGQNIDALARRYGMTTRGMRKLIARARRRARDAMQMDMWGPS